METATARKRLVRVEVVRLLNYFNHTIDFPAGDEFVCLHGPNGVGKTRLLELIQAALTGHGSALFETPFSKLMLLFSDGAELHLTQTSSADGPVSVRWSIGDSHRSLRALPPVEPGMNRHAAMWLHREGIIRRRPSGARFIDTETGEELTEAEAVLRNQHHLPPEMMPIPGRLREFLQDTPTQLVEVGRLKDINVPMRSEYEARRTPNRVSAISHRSTQLAEMIKAVRALYSVAAQRVDRSYASRLIGASLSSPTPSDAAIRDVYADLLKRQDDLAALSLLETQDEFLELPPGELAPWQRRAVGIHLSDSLKKLATFDSMASKMGLFESIVNSKLEHKVMGFDADNGLAFTSAIGDGAPIAPDQLSSGEQHLIVVTFRLLFEAEPGELVLVDEPEISLHVAWQRQFLDDLQRIAGLRELRFIVATHSPQIVGRWTSRLVQIGSVE